VDFAVEFCKSEVNMRSVRIGNAAGFWGDDLDAPANLLRAAPDLQYLTLDYLAEVSMSILAGQMQRDPNTGFARDFLDVMQSLAPLLGDGRRVRIVTNAGGLNPRACATACAKILASGRRKLHIGIVTGDDVLGQIRAGAISEKFAHMETGQPISAVADRLVTANAYVGAQPIAEALRAGADIVITGRVADPSLTVGPAIAEFGWKPDDYNRLAGATVAGHLIECGAQATGGISTDWLEIPDPAHIGFPIAEVFEDGSCVITKPDGTGGRVTEQTIKEQLVYEIGDPAAYLSPDATVSFLSLAVKEEACDRVRVSGALGKPPPTQFKVSATYRAGYRATGLIMIFGREAISKARKCGQIVLQRLSEAGFAPQRSNVEFIGDSPQVMLRISVADERREVLERFRRMIAPLITAGPQGVSGYADIPRPEVREVFGYWPTLIDRDRIHCSVRMWGPE
jgi:hypothetical protein